MVTAFVGVIDPVGRTMLYASAGHLPALLRTPDGSVTALDAPGLPLGCRSLAAGESRSTILPPGSCLLLYTDGLVEWDRDLVTGEALLRERFAAVCAADEPHPAKVLVRSILGTGTARDDVAALTVSVDR
jgi:serine phosphatase RsbU (regulator of sigma subunit)